MWLKEKVVHNYLGAVPGSSEFPVCTPISSSPCDAMMSMSDVSVDDGGLDSGGAIAGQPMVAQPLGLVFPRTTCIGSDRCVDRSCDHAC